MSAAVYNKLECLKILIYVGADTNVKNIAGNTALHIVVMNNNFEFVKELLKAGDFTNINLKNNDGNSALHYAAYNNNIEIVAELLKAGAVTNITNNAGNIAA